MAHRLRLIRTPFSIASLPFGALPFVCLSALGAVAIGCTDGSGTGTSDPNDPVISVFEPVNPTGTVTGQVVNALDGTPLEGASVTLAATDATGTTDAAGNFRFEDVPSSASIAVAVSLTGYGDALDSVTIPSSAGTLAQDNGVAFSGPIGLLPTTAGETGAKPRILVRQDGVAAADVILESRLDVGFFVAGNAFGQLIGTAVADGDGFVVDGFPDLRMLAVALPTARVRIAISPSDIAAFRPTVIDLAVGAMLSEGTVVVDLVPTVEPPPPEPDPEPGFLEGDPLSVEESNLVDFVDAGALLPSELVLANGVTLTFNRPVLAGTFFADAIAADGTAVSTSVSTGDNLAFDISFTGDQSGGEEIRLVVDAIADAPASEALAPFRAEGTFFIADPAQVTVASARWANGNALNDAACPDGNNNRALVLDLSGAIGGRVLANGGAEAAGLNQFIKVGIFNGAGGSLNLFNPDTGDAVEARLTETTSSGSGFRTRLIIPFVDLVNPPPNQGNNPDSVAVVLKFNDLTIDDEIGGGGDIVIRRPNGQPMSEISAVVSVERAGCQP